MLSVIIFSSEARILSNKLEICAYTFSPHNATPLEWLDRTINITFRLNQGFYNYFILYETIFNRYCKPNTEHLPQMYMCVLNSKGEIAVKFTFEDIQKCVFKR